MEQELISINRAVASILPFVYALYLPIPSMFLPGFTTRYLEIAARLIYVYCAAATLLFFRGLQLPRWQGLINLAAALAIPFLVITQRQMLNENSIGAWLVLGTAVVLTATAVRQQARLALLGITILIAVLIVEYGQGA